MSKKSRQAPKPIRDGYTPKAGPKSRGWKGNKKERRAALRRPQNEVARAVLDAPRKRAREAQAARAQRNRAIRDLTHGSPAHKAALLFLALFPGVPCEPGQNRMTATEEAVKAEIDNTVSKSALRLGCMTAKAALKAAQRK